MVTVAVDIVADEPDAAVAAVVVVPVTEAEVVSLGKPEDGTVLVSVVVAVPVVEAEVETVVVAFAGTSSGKAVQADSNNTNVSNKHTVFFIPYHPFSLSL